MHVTSRDYLYTNFTVEFCAFVFQVHVGYSKQIVGIIEYASEFNIMIIIIVVLCAVLIIGGMVAFLSYRRIKKRQKMKIDQFMTEMHDLEQNTMRINQDGL